MAYDDSYWQKQESPADADKPARRESMQKIAPIRREINCRQAKDLFEVTQQPSAPSGEWFWRI